MNVKNNLAIFMIISLFFFAMFLSVGCTNNIATVLKSSNSEVVKNYFFGKSENFAASVQSGQREDPYVYDGVANNKVDFSIVTLFVESDENFLNADVVVNNVEKNYIFELDVLSGNYKVDTGQFVADDAVKIVFDEEEILLNNVSNNFGINFKKAFEIAFKEMEEPVKQLTSKNKLEAECYLRILESKDASSSKVFWYFYIFGKNQTSAYCVIDTETGKIVK